MTLKLLQLNIWRGRFINNIIDYIKRENFDICTFQEVTANIPAYDIKTDCFSKLQNSLKLKGVMQKSLAFQENPDSYMGLANFYNPIFTLLKNERIELEPYSVIPRYPDGDIRWKTIPNSALLTQLNLMNYNLTIINIHGAWSKNPQDTPEKIRQGQILFDYLQKLEAPFILSGDFNLDTDTQTLQMFETISINLTRKFAVKNTLNARTHRIKHLFPPGIASDHIFISPEIKIKNYQLIENVDLSDHLGISLEFEL